MMRVVLASGSPRRTELLTQIGLFHDIVVPDVDETPWPNESHDDYVNRMAMAKAKAGCAMLDDQRIPSVVIGSDTAGVLDGRLLLKPKDTNDAKAMLRAMSGKTHDILSSVSVSDGNRTLVALSKSQVRFSVLNEQDIDAYLSTGEPLDKAGAYGIQGLGAQFVQHMSGSYSGIMGLPLHETVRLLKEFGVNPLYDASL